MYKLLPDVSVTRVDTINVSENTHFARRGRQLQMYVKDSVGQYIPAEFIAGVVPFVDEFRYPISFENGLPTLVGVTSTSPDENYQNIVKEILLMHCVLTPEIGPAALQRPQTKLIPDNLIRYTYDTKGRLAETVTYESADFMGREKVWSPTLSTGITYDEFGRLRFMTKRSFDDKYKGGIYEFDNYFYPNTNISIISSYRETRLTTGGSLPINSVTFLHIPSGAEGFPYCDYAFPDGLDQSKLSTCEYVTMPSTTSRYSNFFSFPSEIRALSLLSQEDIEFELRTAIYNQTYSNLVEYPNKFL